MSIQKTQTRGFTLVELIVVITILVILGTIAFINLGGQSASARDAKRTSDLRNLVSQVNIKQTGGIDLADMVSSGSTHQITVGNLKIAGTGVVAADYTNKNYNAGTPNYTILGISSDNFKDATTKSDYIMAATKLGTTGFQVAATMENDSTGNPNKTALVMGTYSTRTSANTASGTVTGSSAPYTLTLATGKGLFKRGDYLTGSTATAKVTDISADLGTLTMDGDIGSSATIKISQDETLGLIAAKDATATGVVNGGGTYLPY